MKSPDYLRQRPINRAKAGLTRRCSVALAFMPRRASQTN